MNLRFGFLSPDPCRVCGGFKNNQMEPRYGYVVCEDHQHVPPARIPPMPRTAAGLPRLPARNRDRDHLAGERIEDRERHGAASTELTGGCLSPFRTPCVEAHNANDLVNRRFTTPAQHRGRGEAARLGMTTPRPAILLVAGRGAP